MAWTRAIRIFIAIGLTCVWSREVPGQCPVTDSLRFLQILRGGEDGISNLENPFHLTISPDGKNVYVAVTGDIEEFTTPGSFAVFSRNEILGELTLIQELNDSDVDDNGIGFAASISISPDGKHAYATAHTSPALRGQGLIITFDRNPETGELTFIETILGNDPESGEKGMEGIGGAVSPVVSPDGSHVYVAGFGDPLNGENTILGSVAVFSRNQETGGLTLIEVHSNRLEGLEDLGGVLTIVLSPDGNHLYAGAQGGGFEEANGGIFVFSRDAVTGRLTLIETQNPVTQENSGSPSIVTISPDGAHVYVVAGLFLRIGPSPNTITIYSRNPSNGRLTFVEDLDVNDETVDGINFAISMAISPNGEKLYLGSLDVKDDPFAVPNGMIYSFSRDIESGRLTLLEMVKGTRNCLREVDMLPLSLATNGFNLYSSANDGIATFATEPFTGPSEIFVSPDGDNRNAGTEEEPLLDILTAQCRVSSSAENPATIHLAPGTYSEEVVLCDYVSLIGTDPDTTILQFFSEEDTDHFVLEAAEGAVIEGIQITTPEPTNEVVDLLRIRNVSATVENVTFDGKDNRNSFGITVSGVQSSDTVVMDCLFRRIGSGVQALETHAEFRSNTFESVREDAVFIRPPAKSRFGSPPASDVPLFGDDSIEGSGDNTFDTVLGNFIVNNTATTLKAENNDWMLTDTETISAKMMGPVDFEPFIGQSNPEGDPESGQPTGLINCPAESFQPVAGLQLLPALRPFRQAVLDGSSIGVSLISTYYILSAKN